MSEKLILFAAFVVSMLLMSVNYRKKRKKIVFFGDPITNQGARPGGYITHIIRLLKEEEIEYNYELTGAGIDGNKINDLYVRLEEDILAKGADIIVIFIGVNDVWNRFEGKGTDEAEFKTIYEAIINKLDAAFIKIVLCTPTVIGEKTDFSNAFDAGLNNYSDIIRDLAAKNNLPLVDLRKAFITYNLANNINNEEQGILTVDGVHLNNKGNRLAAAEMWKVLQAM